MTIAPQSIQPKGERLHDAANWNADEWHLFLCQHCDNRATSPNGMNTVALKIADALTDIRAKVDELTAALGTEREACINIAAQCARGIAIEVNGETHLLGVMMKDPATAQYATATAIMEAIEGSSSTLNSQDRGTI